MRTRLAGAALAAGLLLGSASPARAEEAGGAVKAKADEALITKKEKNLKMGEVTIQGEQERPKAMFILPKATVTIEDDNEDRSFGSDIARPMNRRAMEGYAIVTKPAEGR
ncbi:MAG: hypothetical protein K8I02_10475 [Candidatus Methylomirabilis sp.]|nr:hypothetical protein [Deltaproteobacteria bacterium]